MSAPWDYVSAQPGSSREFLASAQLFVSNVAASALRKPQNRKKYDSLLAGIPDDNRKIKEKASFLNSSKYPTTSGQWRDVTCKLSEEKKRCIFSLYLDGTMLYQTVFVHLLKQTDIRVTDNSLFFRKACLGIYCPNDKRQTTAETNEPIFLQFNNVDMCGTWTVLLKSYAIPEIYGPETYASDGGAFRVWRQVEVTIIQGRNLGDTRPDDSAIGFDSPEPEMTGFYVFCEVMVNEIVYGRTTTKNFVAPLWHETITLNDLPPFQESDYLEIRVWKEKKISKSVFLGAVRIVPRVFPFIADQSWYPVLQDHRGRLAASTQAGELQLNLKFNQEIILPQKAYSGLCSILKSRNFLDWINDFQKKLKLTTVSTHIMSIADAQNTLVEQIIEYTAREMERTPFSQDTLFRGNTTLTKVMEICMMWYGKSFLEASVGSVIRKLCEERVAIEIDADRRNQGEDKAVDAKQVKQLVDWCKEIWTQIYSVRNECPEETKKLFGTIRKLVEKRMDETKQNKYPNLPWQSVSAFCFLRFIVPAILHPHLFGICPGIPRLATKRTLTLIARVIQSLANLNTVQHKDSIMRMKELQEFLEENRNAMFEYLKAVSGESSNSSRVIKDSRERVNIINTLRERIVFMPPLEREAIPILPHFSDVPRHLASIAAAVYRQARYNKPTQEDSDEGSEALNSLLLRCTDVQEEAARRVIGPVPNESPLTHAKLDSSPFDARTQANRTTTVSVAGPSSKVDPSPSSIHYTP